MAMAVAAVAVIPLGARQSGALLDNPQLLLAGIGVAVLSTVIPFSLEHATLKRLPARTFGVLMSLEPAIAAVVGVVVLGEALGLRGLLALGCVTLASAGSARFRKY
jgi:inner membrane transporter RhtA